MSQVSRKAAAVVGISALVAGCAWEQQVQSARVEAEAAATRIEESPPPPPIGGLPVELTVRQRSTTPVPGSADHVRLKIADITAGQVMASVAAADGSPLLSPTSLKTADSAKFRFQETDYTVTLKKLDNALIGEDFATIEVAQAGAEAPELTEAEKIEALIRHVESLEGAKFLRNGGEHAPQEAAEHLREKWKNAGKPGMTAAEFIEAIASKSFLSGEEYEIRMPDGSALPAGKALRERLAELEGRK